MENVNTHFPEYEEKQKGHIQNQRQGVQSTKVLSPQKTQLTSEAKFHPEDKRRDVFLTVYDSKETIYKDQTENLLHRSSQGNKYKMILHKIYGKSTYIEPMKNKTEGETILAWRRASERMRD